MTIATGSGALEHTIRGQVIRPGDGRYDEARRPYNGMLDRRPAAIVRPIDAADVAAAVRWAADGGLGVAVRGGGHSVSGHSIPDGACVIDLRGWRSTWVDPAARTIEAEGGCLLMDRSQAPPALERPGFCAGRFRDARVLPGALRSKIDPPCPAIASASFTA
jgi:hypothetical protein